MTPDAKLADQDAGDPLSWNLYAYARNHPLRYADPTGRGCVYVNSGETEVGGVDNEIKSGQCRESGGYWVDGTVTGARFAHRSLILTGTTDGENRTSASYGLGPNLGLVALKEAGTRASRDITTFAVAEAVFATAYVSTYIGPAFYAAWAAGGEDGVLIFGSKAFEVVRDATGKVHGEVPRFIPKNVTRDQLELAAQELRASIRVRQDAMLRLGE